MNETMTQDIYSEGDCDSAYCENDNAFEFYTPNISQLPRPPTVSPFPIQLPQYNFIELEDRLLKKIIGQPHAIKAVCNALKRNRVGFKNADTPVGSFLFCGTSGVGKSQLCKALAEELYGDKKKLCTLNMANFAERLHVTQLLGAAPGYETCSNGGQLTNLILQNPNCILLLDELEKAHPDIFNIFLHILEEGETTSALGQTVSFSNVLIIMTCNVGAQALSEKQIGFATSNRSLDVQNDKLQAALKRAFKPEFLNRIDEIITFNKLTQKDVSEICKIMLKEVQEKARLIGIKLTFDKTAHHELSKLGYDPAYGARPLRRVIKTHIENKLADMILTGELQQKSNARIVYDCKDGFVLKKTAEGTILF